MRAAYPVHRSRGGSVIPFPPLLPLSRLLCAKVDGGVPCPPPGCTGCSGCQDKTSSGPCNRTRARIRSCIFSSGPLLASGVRPVESLGPIAVNAEYVKPSIVWALVAHFARASGQAARRPAPSFHVSLSLWDLSSGSVGKLFFLVSSYNRVSSMSLGFQDHNLCWADPTSVGDCKNDLPLI